MAEPISTIEEARAALDAPWHLVEGEGGFVGMYASDEDGQPGDLIAHLWGEEHRFPLIKAAPDLYEALSAIVLGLGATEDDDGEKPLWRNAFDVLAKARGEA